MTFHSNCRTQNSYSNDSISVRIRAPSNYWSGFTHGIAKRNMARNLTCNGSQLAGIDDKHLRFEHIPELTTLLPVKAVIWRSNVRQFNWPNSPRASILWHPLEHPLAKPLKLKFELSTHIRVCINTFLPTRHKQLTTDTLLHVYSQTIDCVEIWDISHPWLNTLDCSDIWEVPRAIVTWSRMKFQLVIWEIKWRRQRPSAWLKSTVGHHKLT